MGVTVSIFKTSGSDETPKNKRTLLYKPKSASNNA